MIKDKHQKSRVGMVNVPRLVGAIVVVICRVVNICGTIAMVLNCVSYGLTTAFKPTTRRASADHNNMVDVFCICFFF